FLALWPQAAGAASGVAATSGPADLPPRPGASPAATCTPWGATRPATGRLTDRPAQSLDALYQQQTSQWRQFRKWMGHECLLVVWSRKNLLHTSVRGLSCVNNVFRHYT